MLSHSLATLTPRLAIANESEYIVVDFENKCFGFMRDNELTYLIITVMDFHGSRHRWFK